MHSEGLTDTEIDERFDIVSRYIDKIPAPIDYKTILGDNLWNEFLHRKEEMVRLLKEDQLFCDELSAIIKNKIDSENN